MLQNKKEDFFPFLIRGRHENIIIFFLSQQDFALPLKIRDNGKYIISLEETSKTVKGLTNDRAGFYKN